MSTNIKRQLDSRGVTFVRTALESADYALAHFLCELVDRIESVWTIVGPDCRNEWLYSFYTGGKTVPSATGDVADEVYRLGRFLKRPCLIYRTCERELIQAQATQLPGLLKASVDYVYLLVDIRSCNRETLVKVLDHAAWRDGIAGAICECADRPAMFGLPGLELEDIRWLVSQARWLMVTAYDFESFILAALPLPPSNAV